MPSNVLHVIGARPNFPKAAPVVRALNERGIRQTIVHTGQHYDRMMSGVFLEQLGIAEPDVNLKVGSGSQTEQTANTMLRLEPVLLERQPDLVVVYGDVNSTVAAALTAAKLRLPLAHVEAGLRSFDNSMPEEVNRRMTDALSDLLFVTSLDAAVNLGNEGISYEKVHLVGNPMIDTLLAMRPKIEECNLQETLSLSSEYAVVTLHRPGNVDDDASAAEIVDLLGRASKLVPLVFPLHPRGRARLFAAGLAEHNRVRVIDPLGYVEFLSLVAGAAAVLTDSGGVQEETTALGVPCLTLRPNTERPVTITQGTNRLVQRATLLQVLQGTLESGRPQTWPTPPMWDRQVGQRISAAIASYLDDVARQSSPRVDA